MIELEGPLSLSTGQREWVIVAINYFSNCVEAKALGSTTEFQVIKFLKQHIISRYRVPDILMSDIGPQLAGKTSNGSSTSFA